MSRIYRYVLETDNGMAPCIDGGVLSLATCKPDIRKTAKEGDWVVGNFPSPANELIAWAARVERLMSVGDYGTTHLHDRKDALYPNSASGLPERDSHKMPGYHPTDHHRRKDKSGKVLIFDPKLSWYFGGDGRQIADDLAHLVKRGIGHTYNGTREGNEERLLDWLRTQGPAGEFGEPRDPYQGPDAPNCGPPTGRRKKPKPKGC